MLGVKLMFPPARRKVGFHVKFPDNADGVMIAGEECAIAFPVLRKKAMESTMNRVRNCCGRIVFNANSLDRVSIFLYSCLISIRFPGLEKDVMRRDWNVSK